jgi:hypothetical protein
MWCIFLFHFTIYIKNYEEWPIDVFYMFSVRFRPEQDACVHQNFSSDVVYDLIFYLAIF